MFCCCVEENETEYFVCRLAASFFRQSALKETKFSSTEPGW